MKRNWRDLSSGQKAGIIVLAFTQFGLLAAALWDLGHRKPEDVRGPRAMWAAICFIDFIGPIAYFTIGRKGGCCCSRWEKEEDSSEAMEDSGNGSGPA
jgi:hypothetical protein